MKGTASLLSAGAAVGAVVFEAYKLRHEDRRLLRERRENIRNALFAADRAINRAQKALWDLASYLEQYGYMDREFRLGRAPLYGDEQRIAEIKRLHQDSFWSGKELNDAFITLSSLLGRREFEICSEYAGRIDDLLYHSMRSEQYGDYIKSMSRLLGEIENLVTYLGERYNYRRLKSMFEGQ